jgi:hypothetical protein
MQRQEAELNVKVLAGTSRAYPPDSRPYALLNGKSVRIIGEGDVEGKSPCYRFVGPDLKTGWESQALFTIIDPAFLPASEHALATMGNALTEATGNTRK